MVKGALKDDNILDTDDSAKREIQKDTLTKYKFSCWASSTEGSEHGNIGKSYKRNKTLFFFSLIIRDLKRQKKEKKGLKFQKILASY